MFDYISLIPSLRRIINDEEQTVLETIDSVQSSSYYIQLSEEGYATIAPSGFYIDNSLVEVGTYTINKNLIKMNTILSAGSSVSIEYSFTQYTDAQLEAFLNDAIHDLVEAQFNVDFEFGISPATTSTETNQTISSDMKSLFKYGAATKIFGLQVLESGNDAILIKDGDTTIDTSKSSGEKRKAVAHIWEQWNNLVKTIKTNNFTGVTMY